MRMAGLTCLAAGLLALGCVGAKRQNDPPFSYYHAPPFQWNNVARVLVLPLDNETAAPHVPEEVRNALLSELEQMGRFEVIPGPPDLPVTISRVIRDNGRFNEVALIEVARTFRADVIVMGAVTQYSPYAPPRLGMVLQAVSPGDGAVIASVDGLWDSTNPLVAQRARDFYLQWCKAHDEPFTAELALSSPRLFQRFVCSEAAHVLVGSPLKLKPPPIKLVAPLEYAPVPK